MLHSCGFVKSASLRHYRVRCQGRIYDSLDSPAFSLVHFDMSHPLSESPARKRFTSRPRYLFSPHATPIMNLPLETLTEIARYIPERHATYGYVVESANIASFSAVSRTMRAVSLRVLFQEVPITSEKQLHALGAIPQYLFRFIR